ncbi:hypothetical protein ABPG74_009759 [Tetrahymena malaccensis]
MGQNQVKKQKKYGEFDIKLDQLQLGFEQERKNNFAMERSQQHVQQPLSKSEQPRPLAATRFQVPQDQNQKRSISAEKAYMALKFQKDKQKQRNDDPVLKKMKEINKCQNVADFFLNGIQLQNVNCSFINTIPMNYNIMGCQQRQEDATCSTKKAETSQFVDYLQQKVLTEVDRVEKIDFEELKHISQNFQMVNQENLNDSYQFDIYQQEKSKFQAVTKIERNKQKKSSDISQIISSKKNDNSVFMQPYDTASVQKSRYQSNLYQNRKQSTYNEFEEVYLELLSDKFQNDKNYDNQDAISTNSNKIKLSQVVKNNIHSDQVSSNSSLIREKKNPQNYNFKSELGQKFNQPINIYEMPIHEQYGDLNEDVVKISPPSNIQSKSKFNPLVKQESTPMNAYPDEYTKYPKEQTNSNLKNNQNYNISQYNGLINNSDNIIKDESANRIANQLQFNQSPIGQYESKQSKQVQDNANVSYNNPQKKNYNISQYNGLIDNSDKIIKDESEYRIAHQLQNGSQLTGQAHSDPSKNQNNPQNKNYNISQYQGLVNNSEKIINDGSEFRIAHYLQNGSQQTEQQYSDPSKNQNNPQNKNYNISQYQGLVNNSDKLINDGSEYRIAHQLQNGSQVAEQAFSDPSKNQNNPQNKNFNISQYQGLVNNSENIIKDGSVPRIVNQLQFNTQQPEQYNQSSINPPQSQNLKLAQEADKLNQNNKNYNISQYNGLINNSDKIIKDGSEHRIVHQLQNGSQLQSNTANFHNIVNSQLVSNQQASNMSSQVHTNPQNKNYNISQYNGLVNNSDKIINDNSVNRIVNHLQNGFQKDNQSQFNPNINNQDDKANLRPISQQIQNKADSNQNIPYGQSQFQTKSNQGPHSFNKKQDSGDIQDFQANINSKVPEKNASTNNLNQEKKNTINYMNIRDNNLESQASISNKGQHINSHVNGIESQQIQSFQPNQNSTNFKQIRDLKQSNQSEQDINNLISIHKQQQQHQVQFQSNQNSNQSSNFINDQIKIPVKSAQQIAQTQPLAQNLDFETESLPKKITKTQNNLDKMQQNNQRDNKKVLNPNLDFEEPSLNSNKQKQSNVEIGLLKSSQASENFSSNFINEKQTKQNMLIDQSRNNETHSNYQQFGLDAQQSQPIQKNVQSNFPQIKINQYQDDSHKSSLHSDRNQINDYNFSSNKANSNFNNIINGQTQYITPQKTQYSSTYIDSTNIIKNMKDPYAQNIDSQDVNQNKNQTSNNRNQQYLSNTQQPTQFQAKFANQEVQQRSRASSTQNLDQQKNAFSQNIRFKDQIDPNYNSLANNQRSRANSNHTQDSQFQHNNNYNQLASNREPSQNAYQTTSNAYGVNNNLDPLNRVDNKNLNSAPNLIKSYNNQNMTNTQNLINSREQFIPNNNLTQTNNQNEFQTINNQNGIKDNGYLNPNKSINTKADLQKDQGQRKIIQLTGKTYNQPSNQHSQQKPNLMMTMESPYRSSDDKSNNQSKSSVSKTFANQNKYYAPNFEKASPNTVKQVQTISPTQNVIYYLSEDQHQSNNFKQSQFDANDKNSIQNLIQNRNRLRSQENNSKYNSRSMNQQSPEFSKTQSPNIRINSKNQSIKKFYESKQEQLERLSNTKQSDSSSIIRNDNLSNSSGNLNKYILPKTTSQNNQKIQGNVGINLSKLNKTQIPSIIEQQSSLQSQYQKKMNSSQISPSKLTQIIVKEKQQNFDDSFVNKDYSEFNPTKVAGSQNQISSYSHIKSMIQETQSNMRMNQQIESISQKSKLNSKGRIYSEERIYSPMNSKLSQTARDYNKFNN